MKIRPPVTFQGGKQRLAPAIIDIIKPSPDEPFSDLCCGSGAVTIEAVSRGHEPRLVTMVDNSLWGDLWERVSTGRFDLESLRCRVRDFPSNLDLHADHLRAIHSESIGDDPSIVFLLLQAGNWGGAAVSIKDGRWSKWQPCKRWFSPPGEPKKTRNSMMPHPCRILERMVILCDIMLGVRVYRGDFRDIRSASGCVYIDPPYAGTSDYGQSEEYDFAAFVQASPAARVWVSEAKPLSSRAVLMSGVRKQGGMSGRRKHFNEEWLSLL